MTILRYQIEEYKNIIEGNLLKLRPSDGNSHISLDIDLHTRICIEEEIHENLEYIEVGFFKNRYYNDIVCNDPNSFCSNSELNSEYFEALKNIKKFIETNFTDDTITEFVFIIYSRISCIVTSYEKWKVFPSLRLDLQNQVL